MVATRAAGLMAEILSASAAARSTGSTAGTAVLLCSTCIESKHVSIAFTSEELPWRMDTRFGAAVMMFASDSTMSPESGGSCANGCAAGRRALLITLHTVNLGALSRTGGSEQSHL